MTQKDATGDFFFHFCKKKIAKNVQYFPTKKKCKKEKLRLPDWPQLWPPAGQDTDFFSWTA